MTKEQTSQEVKKRDYPRSRRPDGRRGQKNTQKLMPKNTKMLVPNHLQKLKVPKNRWTNLKNHVITKREKKSTSRMMSLFPRWKQPLRLTSSTTKSTSHV